MAQVNRAELAEILGVSLPTITSKVSKGMPFEQRGGRGKEWTFDTAAVFQWEKEQAILSATGDLSSVTDDELKRRKLAAETTLVELEAGKKRGELIPKDEIEKLKKQFDELTFRAYGICFQSHTTRSFESFKHIIIIINND